ncbi:hypothetical protein LQ318_13515 [Aliifodinibius salicampi]|uniref:Uncharacterized protein n=1 Tax=Fodinibius salicampi TaxID=1920655 RepID=A0ABT3Q1C9_9BACT|nr:hypothetical protein [Fodinibius salicampi]MCW9713924.1 hypothetical protein [Fodinibius salicampi]
MKHFKWFYYQLHTVSLVIIFLMFSACSDFQSSSFDIEKVNADKNSQQKSKLVVKGGPNVVEITTEHDHDSDEHLFNLNVNEVPEGWTRFRLKNATHVDHFFLLYEVPQGAIDAAEAANQTLLDHWYQTVTAPFQEEWNPYINGDIGFGVFVNNLFGAVLSSAPWFPNAITVGGPGITSPGQVSETTVHLTEGVYIAECYVRDENGEFHSYNGMLEMVTVTGQASGEREPRATMDVMISQSGIENPELVRPGAHTVAIHFGEQPAFGYEHLLGHNVQLVYFDEGYDSQLLEELGIWMDWTEMDGLVNRAPEGATFIGGAMEMLGGNTAYFNVNLVPGDYAWIAEVPDPQSKGMLKTFTVPFGNTAAQ